MELQRGLLDLDRGRYADAAAHYRAADERFSGWWLIEEHLAEALSALGRTNDAERIYRDVVARTGHPEMLDALSGIVENEGEAEALRDRAREGFEDRLARLPSAATGHALEFFLVNEPARALALALRNVETRPGAVPRLRLAQAYAANGLLAEADGELASLLSSHYRSAELHATAALVYRARDQLDNADRERRHAEEINPHAMADVQWLSDQLDARR
jgi:tetratricopeptide (TPR) repeat protein